MKFSAEDYERHVFMGNNPEDLSAIHNTIDKNIVFKVYCFFLDLVPSSKSTTIIYVPGDRRSFEIRLRPISVRQSK